jgi:hypothetical protein
MSAEGIAGPHIVRYGTAADQKFLTGEFAETYDQLVINANMVAHMPSALATLITQKANKPFFIDPQTHAFQHASTHLASPKTGEIRRSIRKLVEAYGDPVQGPVLRSESVLPSDFEDAPTREAFCERVLAFQESSLKGEVEESGDAKYYQFLEEEGLAASFGAMSPSLLVAPYFYLDERTGRDWVPVNVACAEHCIAGSVKRGLPVAVQVVLSQDVLRSGLLQEVVQAYSVLRPAAFLVWVDGLAEDEASVELLRAQVDLFEQLGAAAPVINLYGGYFSVALMHTKRLSSLVAVTHSLEYGESRSVVPVGGGVPVAKFYLPVLHSRLVIRDAVRSIKVLGGFASRDQYLATICNCAECGSIIRQHPEDDFGAYGVTKSKVVRGRNGMITREYPTTETKEHCVRHYMWVKQQEYAETADVAATCATLTSVGNTLRRALGAGVAHCQVWATVLGSFCLSGCFS